MIAHESRHSNILALIWSDHTTPSPTVPNGRKRWSELDVFQRSQSKRDLHSDPASLHKPLLRCKLFDEEAVMNDGKYSAVEFV